MTVTSPLLKNMTCPSLSLVSFSIIRIFNTGLGFGKQLRFTTANTNNISNLALQCIASYYLTEHNFIAPLSTGANVPGQQAGLSQPI